MNHQIKKDYSMLRKSLTLTAALIFSATMATAAVNTDALVSDLMAQGYTRVEVKIGITQIKVEAIRGTEKLETIYDKETGAILKEEVELVGAFDNTAPGVQIGERNRDFIPVRGADDDDEDDDDGKGRGRGRGGRDSDGDGEDDDRGHGNDEDGHDDDNPGRGGGHHGGNGNGGGDDDDDDDDEDDEDDSDDDDDDTE
jgi:hypothetical protein